MGKQNVIWISSALLATPSSGQFHYSFGIVEFKKAGPNTEKDWLCYRCRNNRNAKSITHQASIVVSSHSTVDTKRISDCGPLKKSPIVVHKIFTAHVICDPLKGRHTKMTILNSLSLHFSFPLQFRGTHVTFLLHSFTSLSSFHYLH